MKSKHLKLQSYIYSGCAVVFVPMFMHILIWIFQSNRNRNTWQKHTSNTEILGEHEVNHELRSQRFTTFKLNVLFIWKGKHSPPFENTYMYIYNMGYKQSCWMFK